MEPWVSSEYISKRRGKAGSRGNICRVGSIFEEQATELADPSRIGVRRHLAHADSLDQPAQEFEFNGALLRVQQIIHVSVLHEIHEGLWGGQRFDVGRLRAVMALPEDINRVQRQRVKRKRSAIKWQRKKTFLPVRRQTGKRDGDADKIARRARHQTNPAAARLDKKPDAAI